MSYYPYGYCQPACTPYPYPYPCSIVGATGDTGSQGFTGAQGAPGIISNTGATGAQGFTGATGAQGFTGETGAQGFTGERGAQGFTGERGAQGFTGERGAQGPTIIIPTGTYDDVLFAGNTATEKTAVITGSAISASGTATNTVSKQSVSIATDSSGIDWNYQISVDPLNGINISGTYAPIGYNYNTNYGINALTQNWSGVGTAPPYVLTSAADLSIIATDTLQLSSISNDVSITDNTTVSVNKTISLSRSTPYVASQSITGGSITTTNVTTTDNVILVPESLTFDKPTVSQTIYSPAGFSNTDNSIQCNSSSGFVMNYGSSTNKTTLDLTKLELYNTGGTLQDTILLQNTGSGNPVMNIISTDISGNTQKSFGASTIGFGSTATDTSTSNSKSISINNPIASIGSISYTNTIDTSPFTVSSNTSLELSTTTDLILTGTNIETTITPGTFAGNYLRINLNGTYYKIQLLPDT